MLDAILITACCLELSLGLEWPLHLTVAAIKQIEHRAKANVLAGTRLRMDMVKIVAAAVHNDRHL